MGLKQFKQIPEDKLYKVDKNLLDYNLHKDDNIRVRVIEIHNGSLFTGIFMYGSKVPMKMDFFVREICIPDINSLNKTEMEAGKAVKDIVADMILNKIVTAHVINWKDSDHSTFIVDIYHPEDIILSDTLYVLGISKKSDKSAKWTEDELFEIIKTNKKVLSSTTTPSKSDIERYVREHEKEIMDMLDLYNNKEKSASEKNDLNEKISHISKIQQKSESSPPVYHEVNENVDIKKSESSHPVYYKSDEEKEVDVMK